MFKSAQEWYVKEVALDTLCCILRTQCNNLELSLSDIYKLIIKGAGDKLKEIRYTATKALLYLIQGVDIIRELKGNDFQSIINVCFKGFSDSSEKVRSMNTELMKEILCLKIKLTLNGKDYFYSKMPSSKKKLIESLPGNLLEAIEYLSNNIYIKPTSNNYDRKCVIDCIYFIIKEVPLLFAQTDKKDLINYVLFLEPKDKSGKNPPEKSEIIISHRLVTWLLYQIIKELEIDEQKQILNLITSYLVKKKHTESSLSIFLNCFAMICKNLDCTSAFKSEQDLTDLLMPFLKSSKLQLQIPTCEILKTVSQNTSKWIHPLISTLISHTSITHAELAGFPFTPVYVYKLVPKASENYKKENIIKAMKCLNQVNMLAHALALVFSSANYSLKGVPITISNSSFNAAKAMILGNFQTEDDEEDIVQIGLDDFDISDSPRRESGWILLEGLLHLGSQWVGSKVTTIYKLWNSVF